MNEVYWGLVRHALTVAGTVAVSKGYIDADSLTTAIGALVTLGATTASVAEKVKRK